jgi:hypothetical protein
MNTFYFKAFRNHLTSPILMVLVNENLMSPGLPNQPSRRFLLFSIQRLHGSPQSRTSKTLSKLFWGIRFQTNHIFFRLFRFFQSCFCFVLTYQVKDAKSISINQKFTLYAFVLAQTISERFEFDNL